FARRPLERREKRSLGKSSLCSFALRGMLDGSADGGAEGAAPGFGAEGVDVFVLGELDGLDEGLGEVGEGGGGFGVDFALGDGGEEAAESGVEIMGRNIVAGEVLGEFPAELFAVEGL